MKRQALAAALLGLLAGAPLVAGPGGSQTIYAGGTVEGLTRRTAGKLNTWNLTTLSFVPEIRGIKPLAIRYKSITRIEYGPHPGHRGGVARPVPSVDKNQYLTIFYMDLDEEEKAKKNKPGQEPPKNPNNPRESDKDKEKDKEKERIAVFELGEGVLRPTLRIVETRSGKRIMYQDADARKAAR